MRAVLVALLLVGVALTAPAAAEASHDCGKLLLVERCPWPGGVGDFCVGGEHLKVCFGPI